MRKRYISYGIKVLVVAYILIKDVTGLEPFTTSIVGGAMLVLSALTATGADVRYWPTLPSTVQALTADVPPGEHDLVVDFLDNKGRSVTRLRHQLRVEVPKSGEVWLLIPSLPPAGPQS